MSSWWIDEPRILGSSDPAHEVLARLREDGFSVLVSLLDEEEKPPECDPKLARDLGFDRHNIPVRDFQPPTLDQLQTFVDLVDGSSPERVVVHCWGGQGRTGTFAVAYWIARRLSVGEALARIRHAKPRAVETPEQLAVLEDFHRLRRGG